LPADLDLGLDIIDGVAALDFESDGLPGQRLHEDLHLAGLDPRSRARVLRLQTQRAEEVLAVWCGR
jgi:hypothetical protein